MPKTHGTCAVHVCLHACMKTFQKNAGRKKSSHSHKKNRIFRITQETQETQRASTNAHVLIGVFRQPGYLGYLDPARHSCYSEEVTKVKKKAKKGRPSASGLLSSRGAAHQDLLRSALGARESSHLPDNLHFFFINMGRCSLISDTFRAVPSWENGGMSLP